MEIVRKQDETLHLWDTEDESENPGCSMLLDPPQVFSSF